MCCQIAMGLVAGIFGLWFFWFETIKEFLFLDPTLILSGNMVGLVWLSSDLIVMFVRIIAGWMVLLWMIYGCVFATIKQYQNQKFEEIAREETRKIQAQIREEEKKRLEQVTSNEDLEAKKEGWLW